MRGRSLDESVREFEFGAERGFAGGHLSVVGFVIETGEVEEAVEEEDSYFIAQRVAVGDGLTGGGFEGDGEVSGVGVGYFVGRGEAEDVGRLVFAAERFVETTEGGVIGKQDLNLASEADGKAGAVKEARQAGA